MWKVVKEETVESFSISKHQIDREKGREKLKKGSNSTYRGFVRSFVRIRISKGRQNFCDKCIIHLSKTCLQNLSSHLCQKPAHPLKNLAGNFENFLKIHLHIRPKLSVTKIHINLTSLLLMYTTIMRGISVHFCSLCSWPFDFQSSPGIFVARSFLIR